MVLVDALDDGGKLMLDFVIVEATLAEPTKCRTCLIFPAMFD